MPADVGNGWFVQGPPLTFPSSEDPLSLVDRQNNNKDSEYLLPPFCYVAMWWHDFAVMN